MSHQSLSLASSPTDARILGWSVPCVRFAGLDEVRLVEVPCVYGSPDGAPRVQQVNRPREACH